ncbi:MAG: hypothetical protein K1X72_21335 [Pyrinomonadaceae bacterium]|nr:hypothetical protein [Pyrinomonadaceae bacterium]
MRRVLFLVVLLLSANSLFAQEEVPFLGKIDWINGFAREIQGENLRYTSAYPDYATESLLTRCTTGQKAIEWETEPIPTDSKGEFVYFGWVAAHCLGSIKEPKIFDFYVNDVKKLTFTIKDSEKDWQANADDGTKLVFVQKRLDAADDAHGINYLRLPLANYEKGKPVRLKVVGHALNNNTWYMTFKFGFKEKADFEAMPFILKSGKQELAVKIFHFGRPQKAQVSIGKENFDFQVSAGVNRFSVPIEAVKNNSKITVKATVENLLNVTQTVEVPPVIPRTIHFIHHSHTDVGYSHLQTEVEKIHTNNIIRALDEIERTTNYPPEAQFKWNIESLWAVENFLRIATNEQKEKFFRYVKSGKIGLSALYANVLSGLGTPEEMFHYTDYALQLRNQQNLPIDGAMLSDVPGFTWSMVTPLAQNGIRYFSSGQNYIESMQPYTGDRIGNFAKEFGDKPFWWESPSGKERILFWSSSRGYSSWHGTAVGQVNDNAPVKIARYMNDLREKNYPYELVQWRYNIVSDNGPIDPTVADFVKNWNEKYVSPKIVLSTVHELFTEFDKRYGKTLPTKRGDITPYWEDGAYSTASEENQNRRNSYKLQQLQTLYSIVNPAKYDAHLFYQAWRDTVMFHEHTWGAWNSISEPDSPFVTKQWEIKRDFLLEGNKRIQKLEDDLIASDKTSRKILVVNTLSHERTGLISFETDFSGNSIMDEKGKIYPLQKLSDGRYVFRAEKLPPLSANVFTITTQTKSDASPFQIRKNSFSNSLIEIIWNNSGDIESLTNLKTNENLIGKFRERGLNSFWYYERDPKKAEGDKNAQFRIVEAGNVLTTIAFSADLAGSNGIEKRYTLYNGDNKLYIENQVDKKAVRNKESVHFAFPFDVPQQQTRIDAGYGVINHLKDQLPGSNFDFLYAKRWLDLSNSQSGISLLLLENPMIESGEMVDESKMVGSLKFWKEKGEIASVWFGYAMNNYWHTNYKADQSGKTSFSFAIKPHGKFDLVQTESSAEEFTQPIWARAVKDFQPKRLFELSNSKIVITSIIPIANGYQVKLYNPENKLNSIVIKNAMSKKTVSVNLSAFEVKSIQYKN